MTKRAPPSKVEAFPIWQGRASGLGDNMLEFVEHPDTGVWWFRASYLARVGVGKNIRKAWAWGSWQPSMFSGGVVPVDRRWKIRRGGATRRRCCP